jgi:formylglycine-generating enzyme required for sulfatase activity
MNGRQQGDMAWGWEHLSVIVGLGPALLGIAGCGGTEAASPVAPLDGSAMGVSVAPPDGSAMGVDAGCATGAVACDGTQPQKCVGGAWTSAGAACSGATPHCAGGTCSAQPASCSVAGAGVDHCGADGDSCCTALAVTGGTFYRTYDYPYNLVDMTVLAPDGGPSGEADPATVSTFRLDKYEVTVGRFRRFVEAWNAGWLPAAGAGKHTYLNGGHGLTATGGGFEPGWLASDDTSLAPTTANLALSPQQPGTWTAVAGPDESLPITDVNWYEAYAFCIWDDGFLPSSAEWEYAAAGGSQQREYPWGSNDPQTGNYAICNCAENGMSPPLAAVGTTALGAGLWGHLDLAGNVQEWNLDWVSQYGGTLRGDSNVNPCTDCAPFDDPSGRVTRGGASSDDSMSLMPVYQVDTTPTLRNFEFGFRCARSP